MVVVGSSRFVEDFLVVVLSFVEGTASQLNRACQVSGLGMDILALNVDGSMLAGLLSTPQETVIADHQVMDQSCHAALTLEACCSAWISSCGWDW